MKSHTLHTHIGSDGILKLEMPVGVSDTDLEIILILNPVNGSPAVEWPPNFFSEIVGAWQGAPFVRESQGTYESRGEFK